MAGKPINSPAYPPDVEHGKQVSAWDPAMAETLYHLLYREDLGRQELDAELRQLEKKHRDVVYSELIHLLSHLRFDPGTARKHWERILAHRDTMEEGLGTPIDLRVALVSYFVGVNRKLKNPKVIELKLFEQTQACAYRDDLTGLCNFRYFREHLVRETQRCERFKTPYSLVMIDIDNFKDYNDRNGHEMGNEALATIAGLLSESLRTIDVPARYGGEEFALILPGTSKTGAYLVAERARERIQDYAFPHEEDDGRGKLTVSIGIASYPADATEADELVRRADSAMYFAKTSGKNQVHLYGKNRRSFRRITTELKGTCRVLGNKQYPLTTANISEEGLLFVVEKKLPVGSLIKLKLEIPEAGRDVPVAGRIVRVEPNDDGKFEVGIRFLEIIPSDWRLLVTYRDTLNERQMSPSRTPPGPDRNDP